MLGDVRQSRGFLILVGLVTKCPQEKVIHLLIIGALVLGGQRVGPATHSGDFPLNVVGIEQMKGLSQVSLADSFTFTRTDALGLAGAL